MDLVLVQGYLKEAIQIVKPLPATDRTTWTRRGERQAPRRANEGYTAEPSVPARLVCTAYHRHPGRTVCRPPNASTRSLKMPTELDPSTTPCSSSQDTEVGGFRLNG
jgi:hypothetical protein